MMVARGRKRDGGEDEREVPKRERETEWSVGVQELKNEHPLARNLIVY
jgi:hypothetical protein